MTKESKSDNFSPLEEVRDPEISTVKRSKNVIEKQKGETKGGTEGETEEEKEKGPSFREKAWGGIKTGARGTALFVSKEIEKFTGIKLMDDNQPGGYQEPFSVSDYLVTKLFTFGNYIKGKFSSVADEKLTKTTLKDGVEGADKSEVGDKTSKSIEEMGKSFEKLFEGSSVTQNPIAEEVEFKRGLAKESGLGEALKANMENADKSTSSQVELDSIQTVGSSKTSGGR